MNRKFDSIQACRFLAAFLVLWVHFRFVTNAEGAENHWFVQTGLGGCGVDLFFVISGFVMVACSKHKQIGPGSFLAARFVRVLPLYFLYSALFFAKDLMAGEGLSKIFSTLFLVPVIDFDTYTAPSHPCGWTIAFEIWFYLIFSLLLLNKSPKSMLWTVGAIGAVASIIGTVYQGAWFTPRFLSCPLLLEFLAGCALGVTVDKIKPRFAVGCLIISAALYILVVPRFGDLTYYGKVIASFDLALLRAGVWGIPALLLCTGVSSLEQSGLLKIPQALAAVGNASYSLYLAQPFLIHFCRKFLQFENLALTFAAFVVFSIVAALLLSRFVEYPLLRLSNRLIFPKKQQSGNVSPFPQPNG